MLPAEGSVIIGAGLAGLVAAHAFPLIPLIERSGRPENMHNALLRFRSPSVGELTGIEFMPVVVRKGIWFEEDWVEPNIEVCNSYSMKVLGRILERSIWDTSAATRYIAPEDFYERLLDNIGHRVEWGTDADFNANGIKISTAPMPVALCAVGMDVDLRFKRSPITVQKFRLTSTSVYQTVYFPSPEHSMYRASITGDVLICEFADKPSGAWWSDVEDAFCLHRVDGIDELSINSQRYGKIAGVDPSKRKTIVSRLSVDHAIYSLGRFATWRNILLDDVVKDITVIKRLVTASTYDRTLISTQIHSKIGGK